MFCFNLFNSSSPPEETAKQSSFLAIDKDEDAFSIAHLTDLHQPNTADDDDNVSLSPADDLFETPVDRPSKPLLAAALKAKAQLVSEKRTQAPSEEPYVLSDFYKQLDKIDKENAWLEKRQEKKARSNKKKSQRNNKNKRNGNSVNVKKNRVPLGNRPVQIRA